MDAALLRPLRVASSGAPGGAGPADRRLDLEPDRPDPTGARDGLPRPALLAGVQPGRQLHRGRRGDPVRSAFGRRDPAALTQNGTGYASGSTGHFRRTHGRSPRVLTSASQAMPLRVLVSAEAAGERLDRFLASLPEVGSRAAAERLVEEGAALVDGARRAKSHRLEGGEELELEVAESVETELEAEDLPLRIAYADDHLLVVDKPAGIVVHPSPGHATGTMVHGLVGRTAGGDEERPGIVHRLDRDTSGLLVVARTAEAHGRLQELVRNRELERCYKALVRGRPRSWRGRIEAPVA